MSLEFQTVIPHSGLGRRGRAGKELTQGHVCLSDSQRPAGLSSIQSPSPPPHNGLRDLQQTSKADPQNTCKQGTQGQTHDHNPSQTINNCSHAAEELSFKQDGTIFPKPLGVSPSQRRTKPGLHFQII